MKSHLGWFAAAALAVGCGDTIPRTQVMLVIDAEPGVRSQTRDVQIVVRGGTGAMAQWQERLDRTIALGGQVAWPLEVSLVPLDGDASRVYEATATASATNGDAVARVRAVSGYRAGATLMLHLLLEDDCVDQVGVCDATQTCRGGACVDADVDVAELETYKPTRDAGGSGAGGSVGSDAGGSGGTSGSGGTGGPPDVDSGTDSGVAGVGNDSGMAGAGGVSGDSGAPDAGGVDSGVAADSGLTGFEFQCQPRATSGPWCPEGYESVPTEAGGIFGGWSENSCLKVIEPGEQCPEGLVVRDRDGGNIQVCAPALDPTDPNAQSCADWLASR